MVIKIVLQYLIINIPPPVCPFFNGIYYQPSFFLMLCLTTSLSTIKNFITNLINLFLTECCALPIKLLAISDYLFLYFMRSYIKRILQLCPRLPLEERKKIQLKITKNDISNLLK